MNTNQKSMRYDQNDYDALLHSKIPAALVETPQMNFDDASDASVFFARELDYVKSQSYDVEYPEFTALKLFPVSSEINPGAETVTYYSYDKTGMAKIISNYATDLPRADVKVSPPPPSSSLWATATATPFRKCVPLLWQASRWMPARQSLPATRSTT